VTAPSAAATGYETITKGTCFEQTPEALGAAQKADIATWWPIIKAAGIKAD